jgi:hypothetical protein
VTVLSYKQIAMIAHAAPAADEAHAPFVSAVMAALPETPRNEDVVQAIATVMASPAPALPSFGNSAPELLNKIKNQPEPSRAEPSRAAPVPTKHKRERVT